MILYCQRVQVWKTSLSDNKVAHKKKMNIPISIHDTTKSPIAKTHQETTVGRCRPLASQSPETETYTELYSAGWFDGLMGYSPKLPHFNDYWDGYALGYREYCCGLLDVEIPQEEILDYKVDLISTFA